MRKYFALALLLVLAPLSQTQAAWPDKPVKLVLPFGAGGVADVTSRMLADRLEKKLGQRFVIENMPGPGGINAARAVTTAPPDGYALRPRHQRDVDQRRRVQQAAVRPGQRSST